MHITITGADDSVQPQDLFLLSDEFPEVEWGILLSQSSAGTPRYPSLGWIAKLASLPYIHLAGHLCGGWIRDLAKGQYSYRTEFPTLEKRFGRMQLNCYQITVGGDALIAALPLDQQFIFQINGKNDHLLDRARERGVLASAVFDRSGGQGKVPECWPKSIPGIRCGYAGGLGPDNLTSEIPKIQQAANLDYWVDMETKVRTEGKFDLVKVRKCLEINRALRR